MDAVRRYLAQREVGPHVVEGGLDYLVKGCNDTASRAAAGKRWVWEEWLNDLDGREILRDLFDNVPESHVAREAVQQADETCAASTMSTDECEWGEDNAAGHGWTRDKNWWYWRRPRTPYE